jgi:HAD superfamily hydrolase (TIGR01509 family)
VLIDAAPWHQASFNEALSRTAGFELTNAEHESNFNGLSSKQKLALLGEQGRITVAEAIDIHSYKQDATHQMIERKAQPDEAKIHMMRELKERGKLIGCVTNCVRKSAELMLFLTELTGYIDELVTNEDVENPKPDPEGYLKAMDTLEVQPQETVIVEDSAVGLRAAHGSGAQVIQVTNWREVNWSLLNEYCHPARG